MKKINTQGIDHVGLTVLDLEKTKLFFTKLLGFEQVGERPEYPAVFISDGTVLITLWQVTDATAASAFDRHSQIGLHHLALRLGSPCEMENIFRIMNQADGVVIESPPVPLATGEGTHMMCLEPGGIRIEFIARGA
jgi:catechol 2,3-dioxygenase-like lactoylglutathione lyase family enzyme